MKREDNIAYAKRNLVDSIWKEARLEGIAVTFPDTQTIIDGRSVAGLSIDAVLAINNLKHAWQHVFDTLDEPLDLAYLQTMNLKIGEGGIVPYAGDIRTGIVTVGGTDWIPPVPDRDSLVNMLDDISSIEDATDRACLALCKIARAQAFNDGNKRTAQLIANKILIENGCGILAIKESDKNEFFDHLIAYYESDDETELVGFLKENCIDVTELEPNRTVSVRRSEMEDRIANAARKIEASAQEQEDSIERS